MSRIEASISKCHLDGEISQVVVVHYLGITSTRFTLHIPPGVEVAAVG